MDLIIGIIIVYLIVKFVVQPEYGMGCIRSIGIPIVLFSFFGPIGVVVFVLYSLYKKSNIIFTNDGFKNYDKTNSSRNYATNIKEKELKRLKELLAGGFITQEEFEMLKKDDEE